MRLRDEVAIITGSTRGIGRAIAGAAFGHADRSTTASSAFAIFATT